MALINFSNSIQAAQFASVLAIALFLASQVITNYQVSHWSKLGTVAKEETENLILQTNLVRVTKDKEKDLPLQPSVRIDESQPYVFQHYQFECEQMGGKARNNSADILVIDYILMNSEVDLLEIRIMSLKDHIDFFIVAESEQTFSGKSKPLYYLDHFQDRLETQGVNFTGKIVHVVIDSIQSGDHWATERYQRDTGLRMGLEKIQELAGRRVGVGDALVVCDLDEIPRPQVLEGLKMCEGYPQKMQLGLAFFYYSFEYLQYESAWGKAYIRVISPDESGLSISADTERAEGRGATIPSAGWHCSYCFANLTDVLNKLDSFSHQEYNKSPWTNKDHILFHFRYGIDLFDRKDQSFIYLGSHTDMPMHLLANLDRFSYMTNRRNAHSGFLDIKLNITSD